MNGQFRQNISELKNYLDSGQLDRKKHLIKFQSSLRVARKSNQDDEDLRILGKIDSFFFEKWRVPKTKQIIGIPVLIIAVLLAQILYFSLIVSKPLFLLGIIFYFVFSFANYTLSHVIYHWIFGIILGIQFKSIFIFKSSFRKARYPFNLIGNLLPTFGIKYDTYSFLKAKKWKRTMMFISAPLLTWIWFFINYIYLLVQYPSEISLLFTIGGILIVFFVISQFLSYYGKGDIWKATLDY